MSGVSLISVVIVRTLGRDDVSSPGPGRAVRRRDSGSCNPDRVPILDEEWLLAAFRAAARDLAVRPGPLGALNEAALGEAVNQGMAETSGLPSSKRNVPSRWLATQSGKSQVDAVCGDP